MHVHIIASIRKAHSEKPSFSIYYTNVPFQSSWMLAFGQKGQQLFNIASSLTFYYKGLNFTGT